MQSQGYSDKRTTCEDNGFLAESVFPVHNPSVKSIMTPISVLSCTHSIVVFFEALSDNMTLLLQTPNYFKIFTTKKPENEVYPLL